MEKREVKCIVCGERLSIEIEEDTEKKMANIPYCPKCDEYRCPACGGEVDMGFTLHCCRCDFQAEVYMSLKKLKDFTQR